MTRVLALIRTVPVMALLFSIASTLSAQTARLYQDADPHTSICAKQFVGSADWTLQNADTDKSVAVFMDRAHTEGSSTSHRQIMVMLGPGQSTKLGCSTWTDEKGKALSRSFKIVSVKVR
jgi:hypothetical protein